MTFVAGDVDPAGLERKSPTEAADIDEITRGMLALQAQAGGLREAAAGARDAREGDLRQGRVRSFRRSPAVRRPGAGRTARPGHLRGARRLPGHRAFRQCRRPPSPRPLARRPGHVVLDRGAARRRPGRHASRFFVEQRDHVPHQRRTCVRGDRPGALRRGDAGEVEGAAVADVERIPQPAARDAPRPPAEEGRAAQAVPAASLLEHGAVPPRRPRRHQVLGDPGKQSGASASGRPERAAGRDRAPRQRGRADERVRLRAAVPRTGDDDARRENGRSVVLGRERRGRMERERIAVPCRREAAAAAEVGPAAGPGRDLLDRRHRALHAGVTADRQHQPRPLARGIGEPRRPARATRRVQRVDTGQTAAKIRVEGDRNRRARLPCGVGLGAPSRHERSASGRSAGVSVTAAGRQRPDGGGAPAVPTT